MLNMSNELYVTNNASSLFLELLSDYTRVTEKGLVRLVKIKKSSQEALKLAEMPFLITVNGDVLNGEVNISELIAKLGGVFEALYGKTQEEVYSHFDFMKKYRENAGDKKSALDFLNKHLLRNTFCNGCHITASDLFTYAEVINQILLLKDEEKWVYNNIIRWVDHIQNLPGLKQKVKELGFRVNLPYEPLFLDNNENKKDGKTKKDKKDAQKDAKDAFLAKGGMITEKQKDEINTTTETKVNTDVKKTEDKTESASKKEEVKAQPQQKTESAPKKEQPKSTKCGQNQKAKDPNEDACPVSKMDFRVGKIVNIYANENSEKLYNEEVDLGNGEIRKIASGLKGKVPLEDLKDSFVVVLANLKERTLCGWPSHGMILCASDAQGNTEPIRPAEGSKPGDLVYVGDFPRTPVTELNPKKNPWEVVQHELLVNDAKVATYQGTSVWKTDKGEIKTKSIVNAKIS